MRTSWFTIRVVAAAILLASAPAAVAKTIQSIPVDLQVLVAPTVTEAEGRRHLVYELHLTNMGQADLLLQKVEVVDGATGTAVTTYADDELATVLSRPGTSGLSDRRLIGGGLRAVVFIDAMAPMDAKLPSSIVNRVSFAPVTPADASGAQSVVDGAPLTPIASAVAPLGPPVRGDRWLASHALSNASSHRRTLITLDGRTRIAQRFAIDLTRIGSDGQVFRGDPAKNGNWTPYGADVLAVADGRVVDVQDGLAENDPTADAKAIPISFETAGGNYLVLELGDGRYVFYAHLQPGSLRVHLGDAVRRGQKLALLGNSGKSDAPHLHLQVMDANSPLAAEGLPLVFDSFELQGHVPSLKVFTDGSGWHATEKPSRRRNEMPLENAVIGF